MRWHGGERHQAESVDVFAVLRGARRILLVPNDRVGGIFLGTPVYKIVRQSYPDAHIVLLVDESKETIARQIPFVDAVMAASLRGSVYDAAFRDARGELRRQQFDLALCLGADCSYRLACLCLTSGSRLRAGFRRQGLEPFNLEIIVREELRYEGERYATMLRLLGMVGDGEVRWSPVETHASQVRARYLGDEAHAGRVVGIDLGCGEGRGLGRRQLDDIVGRVIERGARALLFFSLLERKQANYLKETYGNRVVPFGQEDLSSVAALLPACVALIAGNTDLLHLAIALRVPVVGLFDEEPRRWVTPDAEEVRVVRAPDLRTMSITHVVQALEDSLRQSRTRSEARSRR